MDELIARIAAATGIDAGVARKAAVIILQFLAREGPADKVAVLIAALPGAQEAVGASGAGGAAGVMGVFNTLTTAGLGMGDVQGAARAFVGFAREKAGSAAVDGIVGAIPGLSQFL
jgi:hypothetical protein